MATARQPQPKSRLSPRLIRLLAEMAYDQQTEDEERARAAAHDDVQSAQQPIKDIA